MPFRDFICIPAEQKRKHAFIVALPQREEFNEILWHEMDSADLARQLWRFQGDDQDRIYHRSLYATLRMLMELHQLHPDKINQVQHITSDWIRARAKKTSKGKKLQSIAPEHLVEERRLRANLRCKRRAILRRQGKAFPLLKYIHVEDPHSISPAFLHKEALRYREMYPTRRSFLTSLQLMWKELGYDEKRVYEYNHDPENFHHPHWETVQTQTERLNQNVRNISDHTVSTLQQREDTEDCDRQEAAQDTLSVQGFDAVANDVEEEQEDIVKYHSYFDASNDVNCQSSDMGETSNYEQDSNLFDFTDDDYIFEPSVRSESFHDIDDDFVFPEWDKFV